MMTCSSFQISSCSASTSDSTSPYVEAFTPKSWWDSSYDKHDTGEQWRSPPTPIPSGRYGPRSKAKDPSPFDCEKEFECREDD